MVGLDYFFSRFMKENTALRAWCGFAKILKEIYYYEWCGLAGCRRGLTLVDFFKLVWDVNQLFSNGA